jgi:hypothetical protein
MRAALREAIRRFPNMRLACKPEEIDIRGASVRTPLHVPVLLD